MNIHTYLRKECEAAKALGRKELKALYTAFTTNTSRHILYSDSMFYSDSFLKSLGTSRRALVKAVDKSGAFYFKDDYSYTEGICKALCHNDVSRDILVKCATDTQLNQILSFVYDGRPHLNFEAVKELMLTSNNNHQIAESAKFLLQAADSDLTSIVYEEKSGRKFATGGYCLQRTPRWLRDKVLKGWFDYDFQNCHIAVLTTLGDFTAFNYYHNNTEVVRTHIASACGVTEKSVKLSLLSLLYGAKPNAHGALKTYLGNNVWKFLEHEFVKDFIADCKQAQPVLLRVAEHLGISGKSKASTCAAVLMYYEGRMLDIATEGVLDSVLLFDGWVSTQKVNTLEVESKIVDRMGIPIRLTEEQL